MGHEMSAAAGYTPFHPRWYRRRMSVWWWLLKWTYTKFVLRELTSVAVGYVAVMMLWEVNALREGPEAYAGLNARLATPLFVALDVIAFVLILFHAITWFNLAPTAMVVRLRGRRVPDWLISGSNYAAWVFFSVLVTWLLSRG
jgi:fumarate reductase subunit C